MVVGGAPAGRPAGDRLARALGGPRRGDGGRQPPRDQRAVNAALANGMSAHADETDDSPCRRPLPSRLRDRARGAGPGRDARAAAARACCARWRSATTSARARVMALGLGYGRHGRPHSTHSLGAAFGAAAAAGALAGLDARGCAHAAVLRGAAGLRRPLLEARPGPRREGVRLRRHAGAQRRRPPRTMVAAGFTGVEDALSRPAHLLRPSPRTRGPRRWSTGLGTRFEIMRAVDQEVVVGLADPGRARCAGGADAPRTAIGPDDVAEITVRLPDDRLHLVDDREVPTSASSISSRCCCSTARWASPAAHDRARMRDPAVLALRARIRAVPDAGADRGAAAAPGDRRAGATRRPAPGQRTRAVRGTPANPMTAKEVEAKARDLLAPVLGAERAQALIRQVRQIDRLASARALGPLLRA